MDVDRNLDPARRISRPWARATAVEIALRISRVGDELGHGREVAHERHLAVDSIVGGIRRPR